MPVQVRTGTTIQWLFVKQYVPFSFSRARMTATLGPRFSTSQRSAAVHPRRTMFHRAQGMQPGCLSHAKAKSCTAYVELRVGLAVG